MAVVLRAEALGKTYANGVEGLKTLDLSVAEGEIFAFLGPNGAGKTTTVRILNGTIVPSVGTCTAFGKPVEDESIRALSATMSEEALMYERMSLLDNLVFYAALYGMSVEQARLRARELARDFHLEERLQSQVGTFSTGMKKRASLMRCLMHRPRLLFLDEPSSGLDPSSAREVMDTIAWLSKNEGTTIFICTHNLPLVESYCSRIGFIKKGSLVASGTRDELLLPMLGSPQAELTYIQEGLEKKDIVDLPNDTSLNVVLEQYIAKGLLLRSVRQLEPDLEAVYQHYIGGVV